MTYKSKLLLNYKKAAGTLKKVWELVESDAYCADVAHQINAVMWLLQSMNRELLKHHLSCCGAKAFEWKLWKTKEEFIDELVRVWDMSTRK